MIRDRKITSYQDNIASLPDRPSDGGLTAAQLKAMFDGRTDKEVKDAINNIIDDLTATTGGASGADNIGASTIPGITGNTVQGILAGLGNAVTSHASRTDNPHNTTKTQVGLGNVDNTADLNKPISTATQAALNTKVDKVTGKGLSTNDYDNTAVAEVTKIQNKANISDVLTKDNEVVYAPTQPYHPVTKEYADNIAAAADAVTSVFGRAGAVIAQAGDYTAADVGAAKPSTSTTATLLASAWVGTSAPYTQTVTAAGTTAADMPDIAPIYSSNLKTRLAQREAWNLVGDADSGEGTITFTCDEEKPTTDIPIQIRVVG